MRSLRELHVPEEAHRSILMTNSAAKVFPREEQFDLTAQMRRAVVSVPENLADGPKGSGRREEIRFYDVAETWREKLRYFFSLSQRSGYVQSEEQTMEQARYVGCLLHGLAGSTGCQLP